MGRRALFLDRDGVINEEVGYLYRTEDCRFVEGIFPALKRFSEAGYLLIVVTNQAGIARGYYGEEEFWALMQWMRKCFSDEGIALDSVYYCPHHPEGLCPPYNSQCGCRKPEPGMILAAAEDLDIDLANSILVGDKGSDIQAGRKAGIGCCVLVESGHSVGARERAQADHVFASLADPRLAHALLGP